MSESKSDFKCLACGRDREPGSPCPNVNCKTNQPTQPNQKPGTEPENTGNFADAMKNMHTMSTNDIIMEIADELKGVIGIDFRLIKEMGPKVIRFCKDSGLSKTETSMLLSMLNDAMISSLRSELNDQLAATVCPEKVAEAAAMGGEVHMAYAVRNDAGEIVDVRAVDGSVIPEEAKAQIMAEARELVEKGEQDKAKQIMKRCRSAEA